MHPPVAESRRGAPRVQISARVHALAQEAQLGAQQEQRLGLERARYGHEDGKGKGTWPTARGHLEK